MYRSRTTIGPYRLVRKLGEGGMGKVYEAIHEAIERPVAIKFLLPHHARSGQMSRRFINEARAVSRINHPSLVQISDYGKLPSGSPYIVMEYLRGETLGQRLKRLGGSLPQAQVLHIVWQIASALVAAHKKGIIHRDLKPDNIMMVPDSVAPTGERAKLLDFGIARLAPAAAESDDPNAHSLTQSQILGTPTYMSPEQCRGVGAIGPKSDVYSLGVMLYELIAGRPPLVSKGAGELISMHLSQVPAPLSELVPEVSADLAELVQKLLVKDPAERPTMLQVVTALERLQARHGSAGGQLPVFHSEPALLDGDTDEELTDFLGDILGRSESQPAGREPLSVSRLPPPPAPATTLGKTLGPQPKWTQGDSEEVTGQEQPKDALPAMAAAPLEMTASGSLSKATRSGELFRRHEASSLRSSSRWNLVLGILIGGAVVLSSPWIFLPGRTVPSSQPAPAEFTAAPSAARPLQFTEAVQPPAAASPVGLPTPSVLPAATVSWIVETIPAGARVVQADTGRFLGTTPWRLISPRRQGALAVRLQHAGFVEEKVPLDYDRSSNLQVSLRKLAGGMKRSPHANRASRELNRAQPSSAPLDLPHHVPPETSFRIIE